MSLRQSLANTIRDKGRARSGSSVSLTPAKSASVAATSGSPAIQTTVPQLSSGGTGLGMAKKSMGAGAGMGAKNGVGFPKKASMSTGSASSGIKGPTKLGKGTRRGSMK